jgi:predicted phage-related endonuclease
MPYDWQNEEMEKVPDKNRCWANHLMAVMGYERVMIVILNNWQLETRIVEGNIPDIQQLMQDEKEIWQKYIEGTEAPPVTGMDCDLIDEIYKEKKPAKRDCNEIKGLIIRYYEIVQVEGAARKLDKEKQEIKAKVKKYLENDIEGYTSEFLISNAGRFTVKLKSSVKLK